MRRDDREISREEALTLLIQAEYGIMSTVDTDGQPYGIPVTFCVLDDNIYFHCAVKGHKIDNMIQQPKVSFCVVGPTQVVPQKFTIEYSSAIVFGVVAEAFDNEKQKALEGLLKKYSADFFENGLRYIQASEKRTRVFSISIEKITGKSRQLN